MHHYENDTKNSTISINELIVENRVIKFPDKQLEKLQDDIYSSLNLYGL